MARGYSCHAVSGSQGRPVHRPDRSERYTRRSAWRGKVRATEGQNVSPSGQSGSYHTRKNVDLRTKDAGRAARQYSQKSGRCHFWYRCERYRQGGCAVPESARRQVHSRLHSHRHRSAGFPVRHRTVCPKRWLWYRKREAFGTDQCLDSAGMSGWHRSEVRGEEQRAGSPELSVPA